MKSELPPPLVRDLYKAGIEPAAVGALALFPAISVAWSDGHLSTDERTAVLSEVRRAGLAAPAERLVARWLEAAPGHSELLLDLAWRLVEQLAAPAQRLAAQSAVALATTVARATREGPIGAVEQRAIEAAVEALGGGSSTTARREALAWGQEVEDLLPGYQVVGPEDPSLHAVESEGPSTEGGGSPLDDVLDDLQQIHRRIRIVMMMAPSQRRKLGDLLAAAHQKLGADEQRMIGSRASLEQLDGWSACRFVTLLVCGGATYDRDFADLVAGGKNEDEVLELWSRAASRDRVAPLQMVHQLLRSSDVPLICRDYARLTAQLFEACRYVTRSITDCYVLPLLGKHDPRSVVGHAWCLFVDRRRHLAVALDPTAGDVLWEQGASSPFNPLLDARGLSNASTLLARLTEEPSPSAVDAGRAMIRTLPDRMRPMLAVRLLLQGLVGLDFSDDELAFLWQAAVRSGAPQALADEQLRLRGEKYAGEEAQQADHEAPARRGRTIDLLHAAGVADEEDLPPALARDLRAQRARRRADGARGAGVGRNDPCPCGSGQKYKRCCGARLP